MADLYSKNVETYNSMSDFDKSILSWTCSVWEPEDLKEISDNGINIARSLKESKKRLNTEGFTEEEFDNGWPESLYEEIRNAVNSVFPEFSQAIKDNYDPERICISATCKFEKPHRFSLLNTSKHFTTKIFHLEEDEIYLGIYRLWEDLMSSNELRISDLEWIINAIPSIATGKIKSDYSF